MPDRRWSRASAAWARASAAPAASWSVAPARPRSRPSSPARRWSKTACRSPSSTTSSLVGPPRLSHRGYRRQLAGAAKIGEVFPEASHCRHCSGCDSACPKGLEVQRGVNLAVAGELAAASRDIRRMRHVQPVHARLSGAHPAQPPRAVRAAHDSLARAASGRPHASAAADRARRDDDRLRCAGRAAAALMRSAATWQVRNPLCRGPPALPAGRDARDAQRRAVSVDELLKALPSRPRAECARRARRRREPR